MEVERREGIPGILEADCQELTGRLDERAGGDKGPGAS